MIIYEVMEHLLSFIKDRTLEIAIGMIVIDAILIIYYIILLTSSKTKYTNKQLLQKGLEPIFLVLIQALLSIFLFPLINNSEKQLLKISLYLYMIGLSAAPPLIIGELIRKLKIKHNKKSQTQKEEVLVKDFSEDENDSISISDDSSLIFFMLVTYILIVLLLGITGNTFNSQ